MQRLERGTLAVCQAGRQEDSRRAIGWRRAGVREGLATILCHTRVCCQTPALIGAMSCPQGPQAPD
eukprot:11215394-Lingulodinium_polyedra.AAC.1